MGDKFKRNAFSWKKELHKGSLKNKMLSCGRKRLKRVHIGIPQRQASSHHVHYVTKIVVLPLSVFDFQEYAMLFINSVYKQNNQAAIKMLLCVGFIDNIALFQNHCKHTVRLVDYLGHSMHIDMFTSQLFTTLLCKKSFCWSMVS